MIDEEMMQEQKELEKLYESRWGKKVDFIGISPFNQHTLLLIMRMIVDSGDSILVGYQKFKNLTEPYIEYLMSVGKINHQEAVDRKCPLCGKTVRFVKNAKSSYYKCDTKNCLSTQYREITYQTFK